MTTISAKIIADSVAPPGIRLVTMQLRYPRWIHAELMTHRVFSRNASSSRAIPVERLIADIRSEPAVPLYWGKNQKGMQAGEECNEPVGHNHFAGTYAQSREDAWLYAMEEAIQVAEGFARGGYHKQLVNRLLEPFSHINVVLSATDWANFFMLRRHPDAEPHIHQLADRMHEALSASVSHVLQPGEWHLPYVDTAQLDWSSPTDVASSIIQSVARCASVSYQTVDGKPMTFEKALEIYDKLLSAQPIHASPAEHQGYPWLYRDEQFRGDDWWDRLVRPEALRSPHGNFDAAWVQFRKLLPNESADDYAD